jgi:hypothetical protein
VEYEIVFSGRGFTDGRGLSGWIGASTARACAAIGEPDPDACGEDARRGHRVRSTDRLDVEPIGRRTCACGCGGALPPPRELGQGRQFVYIRHHNRAWWQRRRAAENRAVLRREQAGRAA